MVRGLVALLVLLALLVGAPLLLVVAGHLPSLDLVAPTELWRRLTSPDDGSALLVVLTLLGWLAWLVLLVSTLVESVAIAARRPLRLPGLAVPRGMVRGLLLAVVAMVVTPQVAGSAQAEPVLAVQAGPQAGPRAPDRPAAPGESLRSSDHRHEVVEGDDLWSLAERYYGDGTQWRRIAAANPDRLTGGADHLQVGWHLVVPGVAEPGQTAPTVRVREGDTLSSLAATHLGDPARWAELHALNRDAVPDADELAVGTVLELPAVEDDRTAAPQRPAEERRAAPDEDAPDGGGPGAQPSPRPPSAEPTASGPGTPTTSGAPTPATPGVAPPGPGTPAGQPTPDAPSGTAPTSEDAPTTQPGPPRPVAPEAEDPDGVTADAVARVGVVGSTGGLLAAALVGGFAYRRTLQLHGRPLGRALPLPSRRASTVRAALAQHQESLSLEHLLWVQRRVAAHCASRQEPVPPLTHAVVAPDAITLVHRGFLPAPSGFASTSELRPGADGPSRRTTWTLTAEDWQAHRHELVEDASAVAWPSLVSLGRTDRGHLLVSLTDLGLTTLATDDPELLRAAGTAVLMELACSPWAEQLTTTVLGAEAAEFAHAADLSGVHAATGLDEELDRLERRWRAQQQRPGVLALHRFEPDADTAWTPEVLVLADPPTEVQRERLHGLVLEGAPVGAVLPDPARTSVGPGLGCLRLRQDRARLETADDPVVELVPQLVGVEVREAVLELMRVSGSTATTPASWWGPATGAGPDAAGDEDRTVVRLPGRGSQEKEDDVPTSGGDADATRPPTVLMLGVVELIGARGTPPTRAVKQCIEYCAWLLENPGRTAPAMASSLVVAEGTRRSNMSRLRTWLGADEDGEPYLPDAYSGRISLHPAVGSDWDELQVLVAGGVPQARTDALVTALRMVRGAPLADAAPGQWGWAEEMRVQMLCTIRDIALVLTDRALEAGDLDLARWAAARALTVCPDDERLLVARLRTEHRAGHRAEVERIARRLTRSARVLGVDLDGDTVRVLQEVLEGRHRAREA
ncbi:LysM peptidoglycan-binding domain-containing protein [Desertihabitans brevis]|uniref:LysM peptidoglycan-binding domain-containing protein n=1 Tax=Desertihabitans brevis TaxID=2268447 RepID=A0A367YZM1_9ACTN|nr:LysM peptidoglycan-binding domain-containing protein [Desertihabitans brevis]